MRRGIAIGVLVLLLAPGVFADETRPKQPRFDFPKIVKRLLNKITTLDEILTGSHP